MGTAAAQGQGSTVWRGLEAASVERAPEMLVLGKLAGGRLGWTVSQLSGS